jgi:hypothetical protein
LIPADAADKAECEGFKFRDVEKLEKMSELIHWHKPEGEVFGGGQVQPQIACRTGRYGWKCGDKSDGD